MKKRLDTKENSPALWQIPPLLRTHHKYDRGHVALVGGATMTGAAKLAALAAQRAGAGVVTLASDRRVWPIYAISLTSVITRPLDTMDNWAWILRERKIRCVLLGPGCEPEEVKPPLKIAVRQGLPMVLDAGALTVLAQSPGLRAKANHAILTPHAGEYEALAEAYQLPAGISPSNALALAKASGQVVVLKGADTVIAAPHGACVVNRSDTPWLATAGTGDVLAGVIAGLVAQGMKRFDAACAGVWMHNKAASFHGQGMVAEDLLASLTSSFP